MTNIHEDYRLVQRALAKAIKDAGIKFDAETERVSFHSFRHGVATTLIAKGVDPQTVADHLGDDLATVISTYVHSNGGASNVAALLVRPERRKGPFGPFVCVKCLD
jgi:integrase